MSNRIQLRRDTAANWTSVNPVLAQGETGLETDTGRRKTGDGSTAWTTLGYVFDKTTADGIYTTPAQANAAYAPITGSTNYLAPSQLDTAQANNINTPASATAAALNAAYGLANPVLTVTYNTDGTVASTVENGVTTTFTYNTDGTVHTQTRAGVTRTFTYDGSGNVTGAF